MDPMEIALINSTRAPAAFNSASTIGKKVMLSGVSQVFLSQLKIADIFTFNQINRELHNLSGHHVQHSGQYKASIVRGLIPSGLTSNTQCRPRQVAFRNGLHKVQVGKYEVVYSIGDTQLDILQIDFSEKEQIRRDKQEKPMMYRVKRDDQGLWKVNQSNIKTVSTQYAAINGQSNNLKKATWLMGRYLEHHYGEGHVKEYTLFHNPSEGGKLDTWESNRDKLGGFLTTPIAKQFSSTLENCQKSESSVKWFAHSQGTIIFTQAVNYYNKGRSGSKLIGAFKKAKDKSYQGSLSHHSVIYQGTAAHVKSAERILNKAGIDLIAEKSHRYDLVNQVVGLNFLTSGDVVGAIGSLVYYKHVVNGTVGQSPHTFYRGDAQWRACMENDPHGKGYTAMQRLFNKVEPTATSIQLASGKLANILGKIL